MSALKFEQCKPRGKATARTPIRPFTHGAILSSVRKVLEESKLMFECLEKTEAFLSSFQPEVIDLSVSPQDGPSDLSFSSDVRNAVTNMEEAVATCPEKAMSPLVETTTPDEKTRLPRSFDTSPINSTRLMFETGSTEGCVAKASPQATKDFVPTMIGIEQLLDDNVKIIQRIAEESEMIHALIKEKTAENDELLSLMIEISDRQAVMSEDGAYVSMSNEARSMKWEIVRLHARMMAIEGKSI